MATILLPTRDPHGFNAMCSHCGRAVVGTNLCPTCPIRMLDESERDTPTGVVAVATADPAKLRHALAGKVRPEIIEQVARMMQAWANGEAGS